MKIDREHQAKMQRLITAIFRKYLPCTCIYNDMINMDITFLVAWKVV